MTIAHCLAAAALAISQTASAAQPAEIGLHLISLHARHGYETATPGVYVRMSTGMTAGLLRNSEGRASTYLGYTWETADRRWALTVGGITGYRSAVVSPLLVPSWRYALSGNKLAWRVAYIPKPPEAGRGSSALHLALEWDVR
jgi:hypothetical protein